MILLCIGMTQVPAAIDCNKQDHLTTLPIVQHGAIIGRRRLGSLAYQGQPKQTDEFFQSLHGGMGLGAVAKIVLCSV